MRRWRTRNFRLGFRLRFGLGRRCRLFCSDITVVRGLLRRRLVAFHQIRRHASLGAWDAVRKQWFAVALQLLFGAERVRGQQFRRVELTARRTASEHYHDGERRTDRN
jgi:hypothetical protein